MTERVGVLTLSGVFDWESMGALLEKIQETSSKVDAVNLLINCQGGYGPCGVAFYNLVPSFPFTLRTFNIAAVGSAGLLVFLAGKERYACPTSVVYIHSAYAEVPTPLERTRFGPSELNDHLEVIRACNAAQADILLATGKFPGGRAEVEALIHGEVTRFSPQWALDHGLIHAIGEVKFHDSNPVGRPAPTSSTRPEPRRESPLVTRMLDRLKVGGENKT